MYNQQSKFPSAAVQESSLIAYTVVMIYQVTGALHPGPKRPANLDVMIALTIGVILVPLMGYAIGARKFRM